MSTGDRLYGTDGGVLPQRAGIPGCGGMDGVRRDILGVYPSESPSSAKASPHFIGPAQAGLLGYSKTENDLPSSSMHRGREKRASWIRMLKMQLRNRPGQAVSFPTLSKTQLLVPDSSAGHTALVQRVSSGRWCTAHLVPGAWLVSGFSPSIRPSV